MIHSILGVFGGWQVIAMLLILGLIIGGLIALFSSRAKHKAVAQTLESVLDSNSKKHESEKIDDDDKFSKLERLNKLKQEGALTDEEFNREKAKVLG